MKSKSNSLWVMLFGAISLTYVGFEFAFNAALLDLAAATFQDAREMDSLARAGETLSGIGFALCLMTPLKRFAASGTLASLALLACVTLASIFGMHLAQPWAINRFIDSTSAEQRSQALGLNLFKFGVASGAIQFGSTTLGESPADKTLLALIGPMAHGNQKIEQILKGNSQRIFDRVATQGGNDAAQKEWTEYQQARNDVASRYNQYLDQAEQYESALRKTSGKSGQILDQIRQAVNADFTAHQNKVTKFESDYLAQEPTVARRVRELNARSNNRNNYERDLASIYGFVPALEVFTSIRNATIDDVGVKRGNTTQYDAKKLFEFAVSDKKIQVISDESIHSGHMSLMDRAYAKKSDGMPRDMTINDFMRHPQVCSKARAKLTASNISVPGNWCPDDERAVMHSVDSKARNKVEREWEAGTKKRLGQVVGPDLTEQQFRSLKSVNDTIARALAKAPCTKGNAYLSAESFKNSCITPELNRRKNEIRETFTAPTEELGEGGRFEDKGRQAVRALLVPSVAMALSLIFSLVALLNLGFKLISPLKFARHMVFKAACVGALITAPAFVLAGKHSAVADLIFPESRALGPALKWVITMEPAIYSFGKGVPMEIHAVAKVGTWLTSPVNHIADLIESR